MFVFLDYRKTRTAQQHFGMELSQVKEHPEYGPIFQAYYEVNGDEDSSQDDDSYASNKVRFTCIVLLIIIFSVYMF